MVRCCPGFPRRFAPGDFGEGETEPKQIGEGTPDSTEGQVAPETERTFPEGLYLAIIARIISPAFSARLLISPMYSISRMRWKVVAGSFCVSVKTSLFSFLSI